MFNGIQAATETNKNSSTVREQAEEVSFSNVKLSLELVEKILCQLNPASRFHCSSVNKLFKACILKIESTSDTLKFAPFMVKSLHNAGHYKYIVEKFNSRALFEYLEAQTDNWYRWTNWKTRLEKIPAPGIGMVSNDLFVKGKWKEKQVYNLAKKMSWLITVNLKDSYMPVSVENGLEQPEPKKLTS